jgi:hypothetical protein
LNREKPFKTALQMALRERPQSLRLIADRLIDKAEGGDLQSIRELVDRVDGRPVQAVDRQDVLIEARLLTDAEFNAIASGARTEDELEMNVLPPMPAKD